MMTAIETLEIINKTEANVTLDDIRATRKGLGLKYHPDRNSLKSKLEKDEALEKIKEVHEAYERLNEYIDQRDKK
ncbi:hypothetical protein AGMMS49990_10500 [Endomicrobiia bacterium]|nr:hypothetical protein AGMMS49990_10500 [Endomicrobiia bacterium]